MRAQRVAQDVRRKQILAAAFEVGCRDGIAGLSLRGVAAEAKVSHALVLFHFKRKERLVHELLEWLIAATSFLHVSETVAKVGDPRDRLHALLEQEIGRLAQQPQHTRLFLEYWALGARDEEIRSRISAELERYRQAFRFMMEELLEGEPSALHGATAEGLAAIAVSWIHGCGVQAMVDPDRFDVGEYLAAARVLIATST